MEKRREIVSIIEYLFIPIVMVFIFVNLSFFNGSNNNSTSISFDLFNMLSAIAICILGSIMVKDYTKIYKIITIICAVFGIIYFLAYNSPMDFLTHYFTGFLIWGKDAIMLYIGIYIYHMINIFVPHKYIDNDKIKLILYIIFPVIMIYWYACLMMAGKELSPIYPTYIINICVICMDLMSIIGTVCVCYFSTISISNKKSLYSIVTIVYFIITGLCLIDRFCSLGILTAMMNIPVIGVIASVLNTGFQQIFFCFGVYVVHTLRLIIE